MTNKTLTLLLTILTTAILTSKAGASWGASPFLADSLLSKFAVISDYGFGDPNTRATDSVNCRKVSNLVHSFNPDYVVTCGDNSHGLGEWELIDARIYNFYGDFISRGKFYPTMGNHDFYTNSGRPFKTRFPQLFVNEKNYYDVVKGNIHLYMMNSEDSSFEVQRFYGERDGVKKGSMQYNSIKGKRLLAREKWNLLFSHHPPYFNIVELPDRYSILRAYGDSIGMDAMYSGHTHEASVQRVNGYDFYITGNGGAGLNNPALVPASQYSIFQYYTKHGAMLVKEYRDSLVNEFWNVDNQLLFRNPTYPKKSVMTKVFIEGLFNGITTKADTVKAVIRQTSFPYARIDSAKTTMNTNGNALFYFANASLDKDYYLVINHRNSIETWSNYTIKFNNQRNASYDFTNSIDKAAGDNLTRIGNSYAIYSGDVNQDGIVDSSDLILIQNAFVRFDRRTDLNGDGATNQADMNIAHNNSKQFILTIMP